ncbi:zinc-ribbon domain containing protein [Candidatus Falkowbacteria bacterium]|nr:zinc-ribbon domain containing protein [Candidatus Falkowbacteria bacterium]
MPTCKNCTTDFTITDADKTFYAKIDVPEPTRCPQCRKQRRLSFRNESNFYLTKCQRCHKETVSVYSPNKPLVVYCKDCWWGEDWNPLDYGQEFDWQKSFTEQFRDLMAVVPRPALLHSESVNCDYSMFSANNKDCYMLVQSSNCEECHYCYWVQKCRNCLDSAFCLDCELCYQVVGGEKCYNCFYCNNCSGCLDSRFLLNCRGCKNCFGCVNLNNAQYCIFNEQKTKTEYETFIQSVDFISYRHYREYQEKFYQFSLQHPRRFAEIYQADNSTGNYLKRVKNVTMIFDGYDIEDCSYGQHVLREVKDVMDVSNAARKAELVYESVQAVLNVYQIRFSLFPRQGASFLDYCDHCVGAKNCFGCIAVRNQKYCILNKQYSEKEYTVVVPKIINHLKQTGKWGEFFDPSLSAFGYNETNAMEFFPLTKKAAMTQGFNWEDNTGGTFGQETIKWANMPDRFSDYAGDLSREVLTCSDCRRNYKLVAVELDFYKKYSLPIPRQCPKCRHRERITSRNPEQLYHRACMNAGCKNEFETTYSPARPEKVYCEACYQKEIY